MSYPLKIVTVFLLATVKYFYSPLSGFLLGLGFIETTLTVLTGGIIGFLVYYYLTDLFLVSIAHLKPVVVKVSPKSTRLYYRNWHIKKIRKTKNKKVFTRRNKFLVRLRRTYGLWGIALLTPVALSVPFGSFLLRRYYGHRKEAIPIMLLAIVVEGCIFSLLSWIAFGRS